MECDVLATWKAEIGASSEYVIRSSYTYQGDIIDVLYPATTKVQTRSANITSPFANSLSGGCYILGVVSKDLNGIGSTTYYALEPDQFRGFNNKMMRDVDWLDIDFSTLGDISASLVKTLFNPYQYVTQAMWVPVPRTSLDTQAVASINYGWWEITQGAYRLIQPSWNGTIAVTVPQHPQVSRGIYMNFKPYSRHLLHFPAFGDIELDPEMYYNGRAANFQITLDLITGEGYLYAESSATLDGSNNNIVYQSVQAQVGVPVQFSQIGINVAKGTAQFIQSASGGIASGLSMNIGGMVSSLVGGGIQSALTMNTPEAHIMGTNGNFSKYTDILSSPELESIFYYCVDEDNTHNGKPLCQVKVLNTIPGFILCDNATVNTTGTKSENEKIVQYMNGGFYYE